MRIIYDSPEMLKNPAFKGAVQVFHGLLHLQAKDTNGTFLKRILKERLFLEMYGWKFHKHEKLFDVMDLKIQQLFVGGLIDFYDREYKEQINPKRYEHLQGPFGPKVLTLPHLEAGFVVWLLAINFAVFVFICEWLVRHQTYFLYKYAFEVFYKQKCSELDKKRAHHEQYKTRIILSERIIKID